MNTNPDRKILDLLNLKAIVGHKLKEAYIMEFVVEKIMWNGSIFPFPTMFTKDI